MRLGFVTPILQIRNRGSEQWRAFPGAYGHQVQEPEPPLPASPPDRLGTFPSNPKVGLLEPWWM